MSEHERENVLKQQENHNTLKNKIINGMHVNFLHVSRVLIGKKSVL